MIHQHKKHTNMRYILALLIGFLPHILTAQNTVRLGECEPATPTTYSYVATPVAYGPSTADPCNWTGGVDVRDPYDLKFPTLKVEVVSAPKDALPYGFGWYYDDGNRGGYDEYGNPLPPTIPGYRIVMDPLFYHWLKYSGLSPEDYAYAQGFCGVEPYGLEVRPFPGLHSTIDVDDIALRLGITNQ
jgi:hypothetical protein